MSFDYKSLCYEKTTNYYPLVIHGRYNNKWRGCVDCGIDKGSYSKRYASLFDKVVSIDAIVQPDAYDVLGQFNNVKIVNQCLSGATGDNVTFYEVIHDPALNTLSKSFLHHNILNFDNIEVKEHKLITKKLDDISDLPDQIDFLKIDCEGADADILLGAKDIIMRCRPTIVVEQNNSTVDRLSWTFNYQKYFFDEEYCADAIYLPGELYKI
jgi:FkbM family methyltransferase